jgi:hypothetical protein
VAKRGGSSWKYALKVLSSEMKMSEIGSFDRLKRFRAVSVYIRVSDPYSFFPDPDPDPAYEAGDQSGSGSNPDPGL